MTRVTAAPFHPAYGLPDSVRQAVVLLAEREGVSAAVRAFNVSVASVYRWKAAYAKARGERT